MLICHKKNYILKNQSKSTISKNNDCNSNNVNMKCTFKSKLISRKGSELKDVLLQFKQWTVKKIINVFIVRKLHK